MKEKIQKYLTVTLFFSSLSFPVFANENAENQEIENKAYNTVKDIKSQFNSVFEKAGSSLKGITKALKGTESTESTESIEKIENQNNQPFKKDITMQQTQSIEFKFTNPEIKEKYGVPQRATAGSAGIDLRAFPLAQENLEIQEDEQGKFFYLNPNQVQKVSSGLALHINNNNAVALIYPRSGTSTKQGIVLANTVGVIDSDYTGEIILALRNQYDKPAKVYIGDRVAQLVLTPIIPFGLKEVTEFSENSERGAGGFGSSGTK